MSARENISRRDIEELFRNVRDLVERGGEDLKMILRRLRRLRERALELHNLVSSYIWDADAYESSKVLRKFNEALLELAEVCKRALNTYASYVVGVENAEERRRLEQKFASEELPKYLRKLGEIYKDLKYVYENFDLLVEELKNCYKPELAEQALRNLEEKIQKLKATINIV